MTDSGEIAIWIIAGGAAVLLIVYGLWPLIGYIVAGFFYFVFTGTAIADIAFVVMMVFSLMMCAAAIKAGEKGRIVSDRRADLDESI